MSGTLTPLKGPCVFKEVLHGRWWQYRLSGSPNSLRVLHVPWSTSRVDIRRSGLPASFHC